MDAPCASGFRPDDEDAASCGAWFREGPDGIGRGVRVTALPLSSREGIPTYDPTNPVADAEGYVRRPDIDMNQQMGDLILAQRAFQANANAVERSTAMYESAIAIGKGI